ncbi:metal/formaldehyde-sensitive transcriptional repressor [Rhodocyclus tenuis]|uniref:Metal-sensing transcriptional repressor n=2 Tax=Rhodocyclus TaxID=1064 RepID=A0A6L5JW91_RHOTE|nr:metal/formaldehyde-sensitive transcriptional repressor [Rhodocyclus gracilis]MQY50810.1 metal-sensing transcriptional repressor [Rhodocyclus gracilis]MRD72808.1 metal-sensing transcriptional repressor [Rhodocyclus gracilis]NJA87624.1 metal/formaldehyde-sensitive transcriptional repressor [Rhodocyclus gracilis]
MAHTISNKNKLLARVRRIHGQTAALEKLLDGGGDCIATLQQIAAIRGAVNGLMVAVIEGHLSEHVVQEPLLEQRQQDLDVVLQVIKSYLK